MTGLKLYNYPMFNQVAMRLRLRGHRVINPAEFAPNRPDLERSFFIRCGLKELLTEADAVAVLEHWDTSAGAKLEVAVAQQLQLPVYRAKDLIERHTTVLSCLIRMNVELPPGT